MDIDSMVKSMMKVKKVPLDQLKQKKQVLEWQRDDYRTLNAKVLEFRNVAFNMKLQSSYLSKKASSSDDTAVSVKATSTAINGNYTIKATQLATSASTASTAATGAKALSGAQTKLSELGVTDDQTITVSGEKGSSTFTFKKDQTVSDVVASINSAAGKTGVNLSYDEGMDRFFITSSNTGSLSKIDIKGSIPGAGKRILDEVMKLNAGSATNAKTMTGKQYTASTDLINSSLTADQTMQIKYGTKKVDITITNSTTIGSVIQSINNSEVGAAGVSAYLDKDNKLVLLNPDATAAPINVISTDTDSYDVTGDLQLAAAAPVAALTSVTKDAGTGLDAVVKFNGVQGTYHSNVVTINGIEFNLKKAQNADDTIDPPKTVSITSDVDSIYNSIKSFVDKYNETLALFNSELAEERDRAYLPLTDEEKESLSDDQIEKLEARARTGLLRGDSLLRSTISSFRSSMMQQLGGVSATEINELSDIGIGTQAYTDKGKLTIDEAALRKAITERPEQVLNLFTRNPDGATSTQKGLAQRLYEAADASWKNINTKAGTSSFSALDNYEIGKNLARVNNQIARMQSSLDKAENNYYKQFSAMEAAMSKYNSQASYLSSFGGQA